MSALSRTVDRSSWPADPADRDGDLAVVRDWPRFAHAAARAYATVYGSDTPIPTVLAASAVALSRTHCPDPLIDSPLQAATDALIRRIDARPEAGRQLDQMIADTCHTAFRAAQRSLPGPAATWLDHTERVILATPAESAIPLSTALGHWSLTLARITTSHPVVRIGIAATLRRIAAGTRNALEEAVLDGALDRDTVEPLHRAVSHAITAWGWYQTSLNKGLDLHQALPRNVVAELGLIQAPALSIRAALQQADSLADRLQILTAHDLGAASLAAALVDDSLVNAATRETRIATMATGHLRTGDTAYEPRPTVTIQDPSPAPQTSQEPAPWTVQPPVVDPTRLDPLTTARERDYAHRRDLGQAAQTRLDNGVASGADRHRDATVVADGKQAVADLVTYGARVINAALARSRDQATHASRRDVTQQAWLLASEAATTFDPNKGRWTSYLKKYLDATLRPTTARMDTSGTVLPHIRVRVADPEKAATLAQLYGNRLRPVIAGDFDHFNERDPHQQPTDRQALDRIDNRQLDRLTDRLLRELDALPPLRRDSVTAAYLSHEPFSDVAQRHHVSARTVRREARRGLNDLATRLDQPDRPATLDQRLAQRTRIERLPAPPGSRRPSTGIGR